MAFDRLAYLDRLKAGGISEEQARAHADALQEALRETVATKADLRALESKLDLAVRDLKIWTGGVMAAGVAILAALRYFA